MPRLYFDADGLGTLGEIYKDAITEIGQYQLMTDEIAYVVAARILRQPPRDIIPDRVKGGFGVRSV